MPEERHTGGSKTQVGDQVPEQHQTTPIVQDLIVHDLVGQPSVFRIPVISSYISPKAVLAADNQHNYRMFQRMKPPHFQSGIGEDSHQFQTLGHQMFEAVGLVGMYGVHFVALQLCGIARE